MSDSTRDAKHLTAGHAQAMSEECRALAKTTANKNHVIMLMQMSGTWDRMAEELEKAGSNPTS